MESLGRQLRYHLINKNVKLSAGDSMWCNGSWDPRTDTIFMNIPENSNMYPMVLLHELVHHTGYVTRLDRESVRMYHASIDYRDAEEAIADLTAVLLINHFHFKLKDEYPIVERIMRQVTNANNCVNILDESKKAFELIIKCYLNDFKYNPHAEYHRPESQPMQRWVDESSFYISNININDKSITVTPELWSEEPQEEKVHEKVNRAMPEMWRGNTDWRRK